MDVAMVLAGFFFLYIIVVLNLAVYRYGYDIFSDLDSEVKLQKINKDPRRFKIGVALVVSEHIAIIAIPVMLFLAFSIHSMILAIVWTVSRTVEGLVQIYTKRTYWGLLGLAEQYSVTDGDARQALIDQGRRILEVKNAVFKSAQILFSIGTFAYSVLFVIYGVVPASIGWFGLVSSVIYGLGNGVVLMKPDSRALWSVGGLLILIFELILGIWLVIAPFI